MSMCTGFSTFSTRMVAAFFKLLCHVNLSVIAGGSGPLMSHCQRSFSWVGRMSGLIIPTYLRTFTFWSWEAANPRTTMPFSNNLFLGHAISHGFRNLSRWERFGFVEREVSASNSFHLTLAMAMVTFRFFSGLFMDPFLSGVIGVFLHVRCIPHQNSQRLFWASVCKAVAWLHHDPNDHVTRPVLSKRSWNLDNVWRRDLIRGVLSFQGTSWWHDRHLVRAKSKFWVATNCKSDRWPTKRFYGGRWMSAGGYTDGVQPRSRMR